MAVCYFGKDYKNRYECSYELGENGIEVDIQYSIEEEIEECDGVKIFCSNTIFENRDILIIDGKSKKSIRVIK